MPDGMMPENMMMNEGMMREGAMPLSPEIMPPSAGFPQPPSDKNIAKTLPEDKLKEIGSKVVQDYDADIASRSEWEKSAATWLKLFAGYRDPKTFPWTNCSNIHIPLTGIACLQFQARAYEALLPSKEIAKCYSTDGKTIDSATRSQRYLNWQLYENMEEWDEEMDGLLLSLPIYGCQVKKTYYDPIKKRVSSRVLGIDEFVAPYKVKRLEDTPRGTHALNEYANDVVIKGETGTYINTDGLDKGNSQRKNPSPQITEQSDKITGIVQASFVDNDTRLILEQHRKWDLDGDGVQEDYIMWVDYETQKVLRIESALYIDPITEESKRAEYFTAYTFIPNPESWMGFGFGHLLEGLNESANTLINQLIDAGTLSNVIGGFVNRRSGLKTGDLEFEMGVFKGVDISTDDIRKAIFNLDFKGPSNVLFTLLSLIQTYAREITTVSEQMMGKLPPSDTTATTMLAVMEQGMKVFSTIHKRIHRSLKKELKKIVELNKAYLNEQVYFTVQDSTSGEMQTYQAGWMDFANNIDVIPSSDPSITSRAEKLIKAREAYTMGMQNPMIANNPEALYRLTKEIYEALEVKNIDQILKMPEPQEPSDVPPQEENAGFLKETAANIHPAQDNFAHMEAHQIFAQSVWGQQLTPQGKKLLEAHLQETMAAAYMQSQGGMNAIPGGVQGMAGSPGNQGGFEAPTGEMPEFTGGLAEGWGMGPVSGGERPYTRNI